MKEKDIKKIASCIIEALYENLYIDKEELEALFVSIVEGLKKEEEDFVFPLNGGECRAILSSAIDEIMVRELKKWPFFMGQEFFLEDGETEILSKILNLPTEKIKEIREKEGEEALGLLVVKKGKTKDFQKMFSQNYGYAPFFLGDYYFDSGEEIKTPLLNEEDFYYIFFSPVPFN